MKYLVILLLLCLLKLLIDFLLLNHKFLRLIQILVDFLKNGFCDSPESWQLGFQDAASPIIEGIIQFHHDLFFYVVCVSVFVLWILIKIIILYNENLNFYSYSITHNTLIEVVWTVAPSFILLSIAIPSFALLYAMDDHIESPSITLKVIGNQWYWSYEYPDFDIGQATIKYDSYIISEDDLELGQLRLLEVDNRVILPEQTYIRVLVTAADVLHSWAVPSLGIKCDATPGRLNEIFFYTNRRGIFYGQCSEICGVNHGFIPIVVEVSPFLNFKEWVLKTLQD
jgi:cytochrome c oxidase subunit 2